MMGRSDCNEKMPALLDDNTTNEIVKKNPLLMLREN